MSSVNLSQYTVVEKVIAFTIAENFFGPNIFHDWSETYQMEFLTAAKSILKIVEKHEIKNITELKILISCAVDEYHGLNEIDWLALKDEKKISQSWDEEYNNELTNTAKALQKTKIIEIKHR